MCIRADVGDRAIQPIGLPTHLVALAVGQCAAEHHQPDRVGVLRRMRQRGGAVHTDHDGQPLLQRTHRAHLVQLVVLPVAGDRLAVEQAAEHLDRFRQPCLAHPWRVERQAAYSVNE